MNPDDAIYADGRLRNAIHAIAPAVPDAPLGLIGTRAAQLRRRNRARLAVAATTTFAVVAIIGSIATTQTGDSLEVGDPGPEPRREFPIAPTTPSSGAPTAPTTNPPRTRAVTPAPPPAGVTTMPAPENPAIIPPPPPATATTLAPTAPPPTHAPAPTPTTAPRSYTDPPYPPLEDGNTRMVVVLDDAGLHAPESFAAGEFVEILFLDLRREPSVWAWLVCREDESMFVDKWDGSPAPLAAWAIAPGDLACRASDSATHQYVPGAAATVRFV